MTATLIHAPLSCSLAVRFAAAEGEVSLNTRDVSLRTKEFADGAALESLSPAGLVSAIQTERSELITETVACLLWIQQQSDKTDFRISTESNEYFQLVRWISFCATELHKQILRVVFYPEATPEVKERFRALASERMAVLDRHLSDRNFLLGEHFSAADAYLTWFLLMEESAGIRSSSFVHLSDYRRRVLSRPAIQALIHDDMKKDKQLKQDIASWVQRTA